MKKLPAWRRCLHWKKSKSTMFMEALARMSDLDIVKITEDALGYRLPQFDQHSQKVDTSASSSEKSRNDTKSEKPQSLSKSSGIEHQDQQLEGIIFELEEVTVDCQDSKAVTDVSSCPPLSFKSPAPDSDASHRSRASKIDSVAPKLSVFSSPKSDASLLKLPSARLPVASRTQLREVFVSGRNSERAAGHVRLQQQRRIAHDNQTVQWEAAAAGDHYSPLATLPRAEVFHKTTAAVLALNPRGRSNINLSVTVRKPLQTSDNQVFERERSPNRRTLTQSASSQLGIRPSTLMSDPQRHAHSAAAQIQIPQPPTRSRSRPRNARDTISAAIDKLSNIDCEDSTVVTDVSSYPQLSSCTSEARTFTTSANVPLNTRDGSSIDAPDGDLQMTGMSFTSNNSPYAGFEAIESAQKEAFNAEPTASSLGAPHSKISNARDRKCQASCETVKKPAVSGFELQEVVFYSASAELQSLGNQHPSAYRDSAASATSKQSSAVDAVRGFAGDARTMPGNRSPSSRDALHAQWMQWIHGCVHSAQFSALLILKPFQN